MAPNQPLKPPPVIVPIVFPVYATDTFGLPRGSDTVHFREGLRVYIVMVMTSVGGGKLFISV